MRNKNARLLSAGGMHDHIHLYASLFLNKSEIDYDERYLWD